MTKIKQWLSEAPANTMILGEHSVVYGYPALACALDQFIHIRWQQRQDNLIQIVSALANHETNINQLEAHPQLTFVMQALQAFKDKLSFGLTIEIESDFSSTIGLGSSAAVLAAMLSGLNQITTQQLSTLELFEIGHEIILKIQGRGSGTDLAASLAGGVIYFKPKSEQQLRPSIEKCDISFPLCLIYAGYKTPTAEVLKQVAEQWQNRPDQLATIYQQMGSTTDSAFKKLQAYLSDAASQQHLATFYSAFDHYQILMDQLGVSDETLEKLISNLNSCSSIRAAKISGSGLGDCVLGIGELTDCPDHAKETLKNYQHLQVSITTSGAETQEVTTHYE